MNSCRGWSYTSFKALHPALTVSEPQTLMFVNFSCFKTFPRIFFFFFFNINIHSKRNWRWHRGSMACFLLRSKTVRLETLRNLLLTGTKSVVTNGWPVSAKTLLELWLLYQAVRHVWLHYKSSSRCKKIKTGTRDCRNKIKISGTDLVSGVKSVTGASTCEASNMTLKSNYFFICLFSRSITFTWLASYSL